MIVTNKRSDKNRTKFVIKEIRFQYACSMNVDTPKGKDRADTEFYGKGEASLERVMEGYTGGTTL